LIKSLKNFEFLCENLKNELFLTKEKLANFTRISSEFDLLKARNSDILRENQENQTKNDEIQRKNEENQRKYEEIQRKNTEIQRNYDELHMNYNELQRKHDILSQKIRNYDELQMNYNELQRKHDILSQKLMISHENDEKKELLLQSYEDKVLILQNEMKNMNESLADKENYIFELKTALNSPKNYKREKIEKNRENRENQENQEKLIRRIQELNEEVERLGGMLREMGIRENKWEELKRSGRALEIEILQLREENMGLRGELKEKNGFLSFLSFLSAYLFCK